MGRSNTHKSKTNKKSTTEVKHHTSPETRKRTSYLQKKGRPTGKDAVFSSKKQKVSCNKKSEENDESDQSDKRTGTLKKAGVNNGTSPKENRKRESSKLAPHLSAKIVPVFGKKRQSVQTDDVKAPESQQHLEDMDREEGTEARVDTANAVEEKVDEESMPEHASVTDKVGIESRECDNATERGVKGQMTSDAACDDSKSDSEKEKKDKRESMPSHESTADMIGTDTINTAATEEGIEVQPIKYADVDECKVNGAEEKNDEFVTGLIGIKVVDATAPCVSKEATAQCTSETMEDHHAHNSPHDCIVKEEDIAVSERESVNIGLDKMLNSTVKVLEDTVKAGTEHGNIQRNDETFTTTNGTKVLLDVHLIEVDDEQAKEDKEEISPDETGKKLLYLNSVAADTNLDKGNLPVATQHRQSEDTEQIKHKPELSELDHAPPVPDDRNVDNHPFEEEMEDDGIVNELPQVETKSEIKSTTSNTKDTNHELPQRGDTLADGYKVEVKGIGGVEASVTSSEETGDLIFITHLQGDLQCTTSTEDVNSPRHFNTPISNSKHAENDNQDENKVNNNIQDKMEGCRDQLHVCGSTQEFEVGMQNQPYTSPCDDAPMSCDDFGISWKVHTESTNRGVMNDVVHTDSGTDEQMNTSTSPLDAQHSIAKQATNLDTTHIDLGDTVGELDITESKAVTLEVRESEQGKDERHQLTLHESTEQFCSSEDDPVANDMMDLTDSQMIELDQCSMTNQLTDPSLTNSAVSLEFSSGEPGSEVGCSVGVQTVNDSIECTDSTSIVQSMIRDLRQLNATVLDIKRQMDSFRRQRCQPSASSSSSYQQQHWKEYSRTWRKPFYKK